VFVALGIQHSMGMRYIVISGLSGFTMFFFPHHLINGTIFELGIFEHQTCVAIVCTHSCETVLTLRRTERDVIRKVYWSARKMRVVLVKY
jgi:hypothetical protein